MKNTTMKLATIFMVLLLSFSCATIAFAEDSIFKAEDIIEFGSYPQSKVEDEALLSELNALAPEWNEWISYGYYSGDNEKNSMVQGDWMRYVDIVYDEVKYRAVKFEKYRPTYTYAWNQNTMQDTNDYFCNTVYWFKFEPIRWRVIDPEIGLVLSDILIDAQSYTDTVYYIRGTTVTQAYNNPEKTIPANDYETSSIRKWLNDDFYNIAFSEADKNEVNTEAYEISDKVFLLSYDDVLNSDYGFNPERGLSDIKRMAKGSDYAVSQGLAIHNVPEDAYYENCGWILRTPGKSMDYSTVVSAGGEVNLAATVCISYHGVRPALTLNDLSKFEKAEHIHSYYSSVAEKSDCAKEGVMKYVCLCGDSYTKPIKKLPHEFKFETKNATTFSDGWYKEKCKKCGYIQNEGVFYSVKTIELKQSVFTYDGKQKTPEVYVADRMGNEIKKSDNYTIDFFERERKLPGKYTVEVNAMEGYYDVGCKNFEFSILPGKTSSVSASQSTSSIKLTWKKVTGATGYRVYQYNSSTGKYKTLKTLTGTSYTVNNLKAGTTYKFAVKAYTKADGETLWASSSKTITTATKPATPTVKVTAGSGKATLSWSKVAGATGYVIYMQNEFGDYEKVGSTTKTSYTVKDLDYGETYKFRVKAYKKAGDKNVYSGYKTVKVTTLYPAVYITPSGKRYHYSKSCAGKNATKTTYAKAKQTRTPCKTCVL